MSRYGLVRYWSSSKKENLLIEDMHGVHLLNVWRKEQAERAGGHPKMQDELWDALDAEVRQRQLDKPSEEVQP